MSQSPLSLSEHLKGFSAINVNVVAATGLLETNLRRFGPVVLTRFMTACHALDYLLPLKSFTTRFVVLGVEEWSLLVTDMKGENCCVDAYAISRATRCNAVGLFLQEKRRELHLFENGQKVREIQSLKDGAKWYYRESGALQPFEDPQEYLRKKKRERLSVGSLRNYFRTYTGLNVPDWQTAEFTSIVGLERSTTEMQVALKEFETLRDV